MKTSGTLPKFVCGNRITELVPSTSPIEDPLNQIWIDFEEWTWKLHKPCRILDIVKNVAPKLDNPAVHRVHRVFTSNRLSAGIVDGVTLISIGADDKLLWRQRLPQAEVTTTNNSVWNQNLSISSHNTYIAYNTSLPRQGGDEGENGADAADYPVTKYCSLE